jgi:hypothetical protein
MKRLGCEVNHSPPPTAKVKNEWSYRSTPPICCRGVYRENFPFICGVLYCVVRYTVFKNFLEQAEIYVVSLLN